ncbi:alpha/beta fold hydrolase [Paractinoplanes rhizophilus]|uniref:Alpha/beta fold hydrolase n=1 Tax=Paractinoplanes rhizophilus TaxID=1416877 RepID=A0ABW2I0R5_9ACTN
MVADQSVEIDGRVLRYCLHGPADGFPVVAHNGTPSTRFRRPDQIAVMHECGVRVLMADRPGYGGSTRRPGRSVADVAEDVRALADAQGWERFAVFGGSGGGPHALACAALLPKRVIRCAVLSGIMPPEDAEPPDEQTLRPKLEQISRDIMAKVAAGGPEMQPSWTATTAGSTTESPSRTSPGRRDTTTTADTCPEPAHFGRSSTGSAHPVRANGETVRANGESGIGPVWRSESFYA